MSAVDDLLEWVDKYQRPADFALHNGDPEPRLAIYSRNEPVTVLGALESVTGSDNVRKLFRRLGERFSNCTSFELDIIAAGASGDVGYTAGYERTSASVNGEPRQYELRVTHAYRREDGDWKIAHRHGDPGPAAALPR